MDEADRAFELMRRGDMFGTSFVKTRFGLAVRCPELPLRQDSNYLLVDTTHAPAAEIASTVDCLELRAVVVRDAGAAARLERELSRLGWTCHRGLVMVQRRPPGRESAGLVVEVEAELLRPLRRQVTLSHAWGSPELADQLLDAKAEIARRVETHFLAVLVEGDVAACAELYLGHGIAQIEDVFTVPEHRDRGYASALVLDGTRRARDAGADLVFLVTDADDWPKRLYERLGFETVGRYWKFFT